MLSSQSYTKTQRLYSSCYLNQERLGISENERIWSKNKFIADRTNRLLRLDSSKKSITKPFNKLCASNMKKTSPWTLVMVMRNGPRRLHEKKLLIRWFELRWPGISGEGGKGVEVVSKFTVLNWQLNDSREWERSLFKGLQVIGLRRRFDWVKRGISLEDGVER